MAVNSARCGGSSDLKSMPKFCCFRVGYCSADPLCFCSVLVTARRAPTALSRHTRKRRMKQ